MLVRFSILLSVLALIPVACTVNAAQPTLAWIAAQVDEGNGDSVEPLLLELLAANPGDAEAMTQLARIEYIRATDGRAQPVSGFMMNFDPAHMDAAERWAERAVAANPKHANAWIAYGQIKNARMQPEESLKMLERAESLDPRSIKLRLRKGATLRSLAEYTGDRSLLGAAAHEFSLAIKGPVDDDNEVLASQQLAQLYAGNGQYQQALETLSKALRFAKGNDRAFLLDDRAKAHLDAGQVDLALEDSRAALDIVDFGVGRTTLAYGLMVKAGLAMREGDSKQAASFARRAEQSGVSPRQIMPLLASKPGTFPAIYAALLPGMKARGGDRLAAGAIGESAWFVSADDLRKLHALGVDFGNADEHFGTLLHRAIQYDNVEAVRALLELGVDTSVRHPNGATLLETALVGTSPKRQEIRRLVLAKVGAPEGWKDPGVDMPVEGRWYRAERQIGVIGNPGNKRIEAGMTLLSKGRCWSTQPPPTICLTFDSRPNVYFGTVSIPLSSVEDLKALREVAAPVLPASPPQPPPAATPATPAKPARPVKLQPSSDGLFLVPAPADKD